MLDIFASFLQAYVYGKPVVHDLQVFGLEDLCTGLVILVRTEPNGDDGWGLPWSLGRIVRMQPSKKTVDVLWLKPSAGKEAGNRYSVELYECSVSSCCCKYGWLASLIL